MTAADDALRCCLALADILHAGGVRDVAYGGGSRSTPIVLAFARHGGFRMHPHADERSAGFFALGAARAGRAPAVVLTTSGTAAANLYPAVIEAAYGFVGLIAITADRPPELHGVGSPQTIDQSKLFGSMVRSCIELAPPASADEVVWREHAHSALQHARAGPVHINVQLREPLVPTGAWTVSPASNAAQRVLEAAADALVAVAAAARASVTEDAVDEARTITHLTSDVEQGLIVVGSADCDDASAEAILQLSMRTGWPVLAESGSGARRIGSVPSPEALARVMDLAPAAVLQFGPVPLTRAMRALIDRAPRLVTVAADSPDPTRRAEAHLHTRPGRLCSLVGCDRGPTDWTRTWIRSGERAADAIDTVLDDAPPQAEQRIVRDVLPTRGTIVVGASMAVRHLDAVLRPSEHVRVIFNRGTNGIDGFASTAFGASAVLGQLTAICGDLTGIHDAGALLWNRKSNVDFVVLNNGGGGIFSYIEQADLGGELALVSTPHDIDLSPLGVRQFRTDTRVTQEVYERMWRAAAAAL